MEFNPDSVVAVTGFCILLFAYNPSLRFLPAIMAIAFPLYPEQAAFIGYVAVLFFGTVTELIGAGLSISGLSREV